MTVMGASAHSEHECVQQVTPVALSASNANARHLGETKKPFSSLAFRRANLAESKASERRLSSACSSKASICA